MPPLAKFSVPVISTVEPLADVVRPVLPPLIVRTPEEGVADPESPSTVVTASDDTDCHVGKAEPLT